MTRPGSGKRRPSAQEARLAASLSGAVDLSGLKERAEAKNKQRTAQSAASGSGVASQSVSGGALATSVAVTEENFEAEVLRRSLQVPVIVELTSQRATVAMTQHLREMAAADGGTWVHATVDVDSQPMIAQAFRAKAVPMVIIVAGGRPLGEFEGEQPPEVVRQLVDKVLQQVEGQLEGPPQAANEEDDGAEAADPERDAAEAALAAGDLPKAEDAFAALVAARPDDHGLLEALRFVQASRRVAEEHDPAAAGLPEAGAEALRAADIKVVAGHYAEGFGVLIDAIRTAAGDTREALRTRLLELFESLPAADPDVLAARRALATALF